MASFLRILYNDDYFIEPKYKKKKGLTPEEKERNKQRLKHFDKAAKRITTSDKEELARQRNQDMVTEERCASSSTRATSLAETSDGDASDVETLGGKTIGGETLDGDASDAEISGRETPHTAAQQRHGQDEELPTYETARNQPGEELPRYSNR